MAKDEEIYYDMSVHSSRTLDDGSAPVSMVFRGKSFRAVMGMVRKYGVDLRQEKKWDATLYIFEGKKIVEHYMLLDGKWSDLGSLGCRGVPRSQDPRIGK